MVNKYRKFKEKRPQDTPDSTANLFLKGIVEKCEQLWCKVSKLVFMQFRHQCEISEVNLSYSTTIGKSKWVSHAPTLSSAGYPSIK
jgi:hypothetical protein